MTETTENKESFEMRYKLFTARMEELTKGYDIVLGARENKDKPGTYDIIAYDGVLIREMNNKVDNEAAGASNNENNAGNTGSQADQEPVEATEGEAGPSGSEQAS